MDFGRRMVKTTIYSHNGQKDLFVLFDRGAAKMGEISRRDTFETTGIMFRSEILSPEQTFGNLTYFVAPQNAIPGSGRTMAKKTKSKFSAMGRQKWVKFPGGILLNYWHHVPERNSLTGAKIWKFDPFRRTSKCNPRLWSHDGQKDRI